jgi:hypothetical protein
MNLVTQVREGRFREAVETYQALRAPADRQNPDNQLFAADAATRLGDLTLGYQLAIAAFEQFAAAGRQPELMQASNLLGAIAFERGQLELAFGYFSSSCQIARDLNDRPMLARASNNLASLAHLRGCSEAAIGLFQEAVALFTELGDCRGAAEANHNLGLLLRQDMRLDEAEHAAAQAVRLAAGVHARSLEALSLLGQAEISILRGKFADARKQIVRGAALAAETGDQLNGLEAGRLRALLTLRQGDYAVAHHLAEIAAGLAGNLGSALLRAECNSIAALALKAQSRTREAELRRDEALAGFDGLGASEMAARFEEEWRKGYAIAQG